VHPSLRRIALAILGALSAAGVGALQPPTVRPLYDLRSPERSPFPSDRFTVADANQITGRRVNLPVPSDCVADASECEDVAILNQLDGFNMQARVSIPFTGDIDLSSVTNETIFLLRLEKPQRIALNQLVWDAATHELSGRPDVSLDEHTKYALVVTTGVRDAGGRPISPATDFRAQGDELSATKQIGAGRVAVLTVFTTQSFSHIVERMYDAVRNAPAPALDFGVGPNGARAVFDAAQIEAITNNLQDHATGPLTDQPLQVVRALTLLIPGAVGTVSFGTFRAPNFTAPGFGYIPPIPTRTGILRATGVIDTAFNLWLPAGTAPKNGWPVAIYGHGSFGTKNAAFAHAPVLNSHGIAVIAFNAIFRGGGERTTITIRLRDGRSAIVKSAGSGFDADGDGAIDEWEPRRMKRPYAVLNNSGAIAEAAAQTFALVRGIQEGVDVNGDGTRDLDGSRIYYFGQSLGAMWGMLNFAYDPAIRAAVFTVPVGSLSYNTVLSPSTRPNIGDLLARRSPSLLNSANGLGEIDGVVVPEPRFNESLPLRNQPPLVNEVAGAIAIQRVLDRITWCAQMSSTIPFAPLLRRQPRPGIPMRPFIVQIARSDQTATNPTQTEIIRAGGFEDRVSVYRHDLRKFDTPGVTPNPHGFLSALGPTQGLMEIALGAQHQIGAFFESDGAKVIHPEPNDLWETPIKMPLPEDLFFMPRKR
jgi:Bacterial Ig-like domain